MTWNHVTYNSPTHCEAHVSVTVSRCHPRVLTGCWLSVVWEESDVGYPRRCLLTSLKDLDEADTGSAMQTASFLESDKIPCIMLGGTMPASQRIPGFVIYCLTLSFFAFNW